MDIYSSLANLYDSFSVDKPPKEWGHYIAGLLKQGGINAGAYVIDAACGTGSITLELYKSGYNLCALDISEDMLAVAAQRFAEAGARINIVNQSLTDIKVGKKADAVVSINDAVNYLAEEGQVQAAFKSVYDALKEGGLFLFDISSKNKLKSMDGKSYFEENDEGLYIWRSDYEEDAEILNIDISLYCHLEDDLYEKSIEVHRQKAHSVEFILDALKDAGFSDAKAFECFSNETPKYDSQRIQFSAVKI